MTTDKKIVFLSLFLLVFLHTLSWSFSFDPISVSFSPEGRESTRSFRLKNDGDDYIAIRISMFHREISIEGEETRAPADHLFTVYPDRVVVKPNSTQTVRVKWNGPADIEREECFRILAEQLPVDFSSGSPEESGVKIILRYLGAIYITPEGAAPEVSLEKADLITTLRGDKIAELTFFNRGSRHTVLTDLHLILSSESTGEGEELHFGPEDLKGVNGENLLPGSKRRFQVPIPESFKGEQLSVEFQYEADN